MGKHIKQKICEGAGWLLLCASSTDEHGCRPELDFNDDLVDVSMSAATVQITAASGNRYRMIGPFGRFSGVRRQRCKNKGYCTVPAG
jgi:hypothetical protein